MLGITKDSLGKPLLDKETLLSIFEDLNYLLKQDNLNLSLQIFGGAVISLAYDSRCSTRDIDAIFNVDSNIENILKNIAITYNLCDDWINQDIKYPLESIKCSDNIEFLQYSNLQIKTPTASQMLAMKVLSARPEPYRDFEDCITLIKYLKITKLEEVLVIFKKFFSTSLLGDRQKIFLNYLGEDLNYKWKKYII